MQEYIVIADTLVKDMTYGEYCRMKGIPIKRMKFHFAKDGYLVDFRRDDKSVKIQWYPEEVFHKIFERCG